MAQSQATELEQSHTCVEVDDEVVDMEIVQDDEEDNAPTPGSIFDRVPPEIIIHIAEVSTWDEVPSDWQHPAAYARHHATLARVNTRFHRLLEPELYKRNRKYDGPLQSCVRWAAEFGNLATMEKAWHYGFDIDQQNERANDAMEVNALHCALHSGHSHVVAFLLEHGANVHGPSSPTLCVKCNVDWKLYHHMSTDTLEPVYPLHTALVHGKRQDARRLVEHGAYLVAKNISAIFGLFRSGHIDLVRQYLLDRTDPVSQDAQLLFAAATKDLPLLTRLLDRPGVSLARATNTAQENALHLAVGSPGPQGASVEDAVDTVEFLCQHPDINVSAVDGFGRTAFLQAVQYGVVPVVEMLLRHPAIDGHELDYYGLNCLHLAACTGNLGMVKLLAEQADVDIKAIGLGDESVLRLACQRPERKESAEVVRYLLSAGAPLYPDGVEKPDLLLHCLQMMNLEQAIVLLQAGMTISAEIVNNTILCDTKGFTLLQGILGRKRRGQVEVLSYLIDIGIDVNGRGVGLDNPYNIDHPRFDDLPLVYAAVGAKSIDCMRLLISAGAKATMAPDPIMLWRYCCMRWKAKVVTDKSVANQAEILATLVQMGYPIGQCDPSALGYACHAAIYGSHKLLELLLELAEPRAIHPNYMRDLVSMYSHFTGPNVAQAQEVATTLRAAYQRLFGYAPHHGALPIEFELDGTPEEQSEVIAGAVTLYGLGGI
jgi:ankyrin repeat protein